MATLVVNLYWYDNAMFDAAPPPVVALPTKVDHEPPVVSVSPVEADALSSEAHAATSKSPLLYTPDKETAVVVLPAPVLFAEPRSTGIVPVK